MSNMNLYNSLLAGKLADGSDFSPTSAQLNAMNSGINSAKVAQIETNKTNISLLSEMRTYRKETNDTSYIFSDLNGLNDTTRFKYALLIGGGTDNTPAAALAWLVFIGTGGAVTFTKIIGSGPQTLTGAVSGNTLTITASSTMYGGLRLIWLG